MLSELYEDNKKLMLELKKELNEKKERDNYEDSLGSFFYNLHQSSMNSSKLTPSELHALEQKAKITNISTQNEALKRYE